MPASHSWQMEFGVTEDYRGVDIMFYQARLFRPYEPQAEFDIDKVSRSSRIHHTQPYNVYGITPPKGLETMYRAHLDEASVEQYKHHPQLAYAYQGFNHESTSLSVRPQNMAAFLPYHPYSLEHGYYRWAQKSPVTLMGLGSINRSGGLVDYDRLYPDNSADGTRVKIFSNGIQGAIQFLG